MATQLSAIEAAARLRLNEPTPSFWSSNELIDIINSGVRDLWRDVVDLKQEHYLTVNTTDVSFVGGDTQLTGVPTDVHKVYLIEPRDLSSNGSNHGLTLSPLDFNHISFQAARALDPIDPADAVLYYAIHGQGAPVNAPTIRVAPKVTSTLLLSFSYVPTLPTLTSDNLVPIPGEANNALVAWTVAYARAKESDTFAPDTTWLTVYSTEKQHLLQSLGLRQYQENTYVDAMFESYW